MHRSLVSVTTVILFLGFCLEPDVLPAAEPGESLMSVAGAKSGLIVCLGCGEGDSICGLATGPGCVVHGLDTDPEAIDRTRQRIDSMSMYGNVSADTFDGENLPYVDNLVNLVVAESLGDVSMAEVMRVLRPGGAVCVKDGDRWKKTVKPWPADIDEWGHFFHDASGNPVGDDRRVGPPRHAQWEDGPKASRSHENMSSVSAVVTDGGRIFSIIDEGPLASIYLPSDWFLTARDAFNGITLWKKPITAWHSRLFPLKSGPFQLPRRIVAVGDRLYVTLGLYEPLSELDAATGRVLRTFDATEHTEEVLHTGGKLILVVNDNKDAIPFEDQKRKRRGGFTIAVEATRSIVAIDTESGRTTWMHPSGAVTPMTTVADGSRVYYHMTDGLECLDLADGRLLWRQPVDTRYKLSTNFSPALLVHDGVLCLAGQQQLRAFAVHSGQQLWSVTCEASTYRSPIGVCVIDGVVWVPESISWNKNTRNNTTGSLVGYDLATGRKVRDVPVDVEQGMGVCHHRCCMPKASGKYLVTSWPGIEFTDTTTGTVRASHWVRGACLYGTMPANGLIYAPPNPCACYPEGKLNGFQALAPERKEGEKGRRGDTEGRAIRLERGSAYTALIPSSQSLIPSSSSWPTFRHDAERTGATAGSVSPKLEHRWIARIGGRLTQPIIADGKLFVASVDAHKVYAIDTESGRTLWTYIAGGRVDSPPTYYGGRVIFGSRDGCVYSLDADTGELAWRFAAAPNDRRIVSCGGLESVWPVFGSVLIDNDSLYFTAGRSAFLDGGIYLYRLNPTTGEKLAETCVYMLDPDGRQPQIDWLAMPGALPDVLVSDGEFVYMRHLAFDPEAQPVDHPGNDHIYCPTGFLDDSWFHRSFWSYGRDTFTSRSGGGAGGGPGARIMAMDTDALFHFGRAKQPTSIAKDGEQYFLASSARPTADAKPKGAGLQRWSNPSDMHVRAMVLTGRTLFVAGPTGDWASSLDAYHGKQGVTLAALNTSDGQTTAEHPLPALPTFDGMAAADGSLYISLADGSIVRLAGQ